MEGHPPVEPIWQAEHRGSSNRLWQPVGAGESGWSSHAKLVLGWNNCSVESHPPPWWELPNSTYFKIWSHIRSKLIVGCVQAICRIHIPTFKAAAWKPWSLARSLSRFGRSMGTWSAPFMAAPCCRETRWCPEFYGLKSVLWGHSQVPSQRHGLQCGALKALAGCMPFVMLANSWRLCRRVQWPGSQNWTSLPEEKICLYHIRVNIYQNRSFLQIIPEIIPFIRQVTLLNQTCFPGASGFSVASLDPLLAGLERPLTSARGHVGQGGESAF